MRFTPHRQVGIARAMSQILERFPNPEPGRDYEIVFDCPEMTCLCPLTGQPDFARIELRYVPDRFCVESKSLKMYIWSFRNQGAFHEKVTNQIADDLIATLGPRKLTVTGWWNIRGGISTVVVVNHDARDPRRKRIPLIANVSTRKKKRVSAPGAP
jgi:7-cyano-7-deazaguanine reductase